MRRADRVAREIAFWQPKFRLLDGWTIEFDPESELKDQSSHNAKKKHGVIYDVSFAQMPKDYVYHELLHLAMAALMLVQPRKYREREEILVQDLCRIVFDEKLRVRGKL